MKWIQDLHSIQHSVTDRWGAAQERKRKYRGEAQRERKNACVLFWYPGTVIPLVLLWDGWEMQYGSDQGPSL